MRDLIQSPPASRVSARFADGVDLLDPLAFLRVLGVPLFKILPLKRQVRPRRQTIAVTQPLD